MFDYKKEANISTWALVLVAILAAIAATQYWGYYPNSLPSLRELTTIGLMIREGEFHHPLKSYFRMLPGYALLDANLLTSAPFNYVIGMLIKLCQLALTFLLLRQITKNHVVILVIIAVLTIGLYVELHPFQFIVKHPTYYGFRYIASVLILGSLLLIFREKLAWASVLLGLSFFFHPKVGTLSLILLPATLLSYRYSQTRSLRTVIVSAAKLVLPASVIILGTIQISYWGNYYEGASVDFPTYLMALKLAPDDYFFFDNYSKLTPEIFARYSPAKFLILMLFLTGATFLVFWSIKKPADSVTEAELMLVAILYSLLLYFSRMSMEIMVFLGLINSVCYVRYVRDERPNKDSNILFGNPVGIFFIVVTSMFVIGVSLEYLIGFLPVIIGPLIYTFKIWKAPHFNTLIGTIIFVIIALRVFDIKITNMVKVSGGRLNLQLAIIIIFSIFVVGSGFFHKERFSRTGLITGFDVYRALFETQESVTQELDGPNPMEREFVYQEKRISRLEQSDTFKAYLKTLREINWRILEGETNSAETALKLLEDTESPFLLLTRENARANLLAAQGRLHQAHKIYRRATLDSLVIGNEYPIPSDRESYEYKFPERIPTIAYRDAAAWIRKNTPSSAMFLNPPHIDGFTEYTGRNAFFPKNKFEIEYTPLNGVWAPTYLNRQRSVLRTTLFDLPGIVHGNLAKAIIRYSFLDIDNKRLTDILTLFPKIDYIFTEKQHQLPHNVIFSNDYFVVYKISN